MKHTVASLQALKQNHEKITMITAYDYTSAKILDKVGVDIILIGDSLAMVMLGLEDTLSLSMAEMIHHTKAVSRGVKNTFLIADLPFMSYQTSVYDAVKNAGKLIQKGRANAVKLEGGINFAPHIKAIFEAGIPVIAHIGLAPQFLNTLGGFKVQGKSLEAAQSILDDARAVEKAGAFAILLECVPEALGTKISQSVKIPVIGIGAGAKCDGQVLVMQDILGLNTDFKPKFVKVFQNAREAYIKGFSEFIKEVKNKSFPAKEHEFNIDESVISALK